MLVLCLRQTMSSVAPVLCGPAGFPAFWLGGRYVLYRILGVDGFFTKEVLYPSSTIRLLRGFISSHHVYIYIYMYVYIYMGEAVSPPVTIIMLKTIAKSKQQQQKPNLLLKCSHKAFVNSTTIKENKQIREINSSSHVPRLMASCL